MWLPVGQHEPVGLHPAPATSSSQLERQVHVVGVQGEEPAKVLAVGPLPLLVADPRERRLEPVPTLQRASPLRRTPRWCHTRWWHAVERAQPRQLRPLRRVQLIADPRRPFTWIQRDRVPPA